MKSSTWLMVGMLGLAVWTGLGPASGEAAVINPVGPTFPFAPIASAVTISILKAGVDVTASWLPEPGEMVSIVVNGLPGATIALVCPDGTTTASTCADASASTSNPIAIPARRTSAYPGQCTNFDNPLPSKYATDFQLSGNSLTSTDCGGMAVIQVTAPGSPTYTFILPQDANFNGIADIWEQQFCPAGVGTQAAPCLTATGDGDSSPGNAAGGDGLANFDEYRGFIVSGVHVRTDPTQKDLFVHLVNPQCVPDANPLLSTASLLGGPNAIVSGNSLFSNVDTLISSTRIHRLGYPTPNDTHLRTNEWVDRFDHYSVADDLRFVADDGFTITSIPPATDRQVNKNAVYTTVPQKGLRIIECVDQTSSPSLLGFASLGSPNGPDNAIIYTQRIVNYFTNSLSAVCATDTTPCLFYSTFQNGVWTAPVPISPRSLFGAAFAFYLAMELGHSVQLTPTLEGSAKTSYGYHHAPGTGSNLDLAITQKASSKNGNTFWIPLLYNTSDLVNYQLK